MMPLPNCDSVECPLFNLQNLAGLELPKFAIGAVVSCQWVDEDGQPHCDVGTIVGLFPAPNGWLDGWWYVVRFPVVSGCEWLNLPCDDETHESDLELISLDKTIETA